MRTLAACTIVPVTGTAPGLAFLNVAPAAPSGTPSVAAKGFRTDAATSLQPRATVNTAGTLTEGTAAQTRAATGQWVLGLMRMVDRTRAIAKATCGGTDASPPAIPQSRFRAKIAAQQPGTGPLALASIASAVNTALLATGADVNVTLGLFWGGTSGAYTADDMSATTGAGLIHVAVFDLDSVAQAF